MGDFYPKGVISTLHRLPAGDTDHLESEIQRRSHLNPVTLLLACLDSEIEGSSSDAGGA